MSTALRILVVDDSKVARTVVTGLIRNRRPEVSFLEAGDGRSALALALAERPDLSILDINMPDMTGLMVAEELRRQAPELRIAILTANVQDATRAKAEALQVPLFRKPAKGEVIDDILKLLAP